MADDHSLSQEDIDALINQVGGGSPSPTPPTPTTSPPATAAAGPLGQDDIDALINQVTKPPTVAVANAGAANSPQSQSKAISNSGAPEPAGPLGQDDIDALINQVTRPPTAAVANAGTGTAGKKAQASGSSGQLGQDDIDALINQVANPTTATVTSTGFTATATATSGSQSKTGTSTKTGPLGQDDIDQLLAELGTTSRTNAGASATGTTSRPSVPTTSAAQASDSQRQGTTSNGPTLALSPDDLDALVDKQAGQTSNHREAPMIDQTDIDALVRQLANATGEPDTKKISEALAKHEGEIDQLLTTNPDPRMTVDAVEVPAARKASTSIGAAPVHTSTLPVMAPAELRGTRWLLAAAVLFLAICATTLVLVVGAISGLQQQLKTQHLAQLAPSDVFADDFKAALAQLATGDNDQAAKGVLFLQRLKIRHPSHDGEIALELARHFRANGLHRQAAEEYASLAESGPFDDPRVYLEYSDALAQGRDLSGAIRQVYHLLASEEAYLGPRDRRNQPRPADEVARNRDALRDAYLALGRLLSTGWDEQRGGTRVVATKPPSASNATPAKPATPEHGSSHSAGHQP